MEAENRHEQFPPFVYTFLCLYKGCEGVKTEREREEERMVSIHFSLSPILGTLGRRRKEEE